MADTIVFQGYQDVTGQIAQTDPVTSGEVGIVPQIVAAFPHPPPYAGAPTPIGETFDPMVQFDVGVPAAPSSPALPNGVGVICGGFEEQLYESIHVIPARISLGNVLQLDVRTFEVWNAFRKTAQTLASIAESGTEGITLNEPAATPLLYAPLSSKDYSIDVTDDGPAVVDALYTFDFTVESPTLAVTGTRIVAFAFIPQQNLIEILEWKTDVMEGFDGDEQRVRGRKLPRQLFNMKYLFTEDQERNTALNTLTGHHGLALAVPMWQFQRDLDTDLSIDVSVIPVNTVDADFRDSTTEKAELVILWRDFNDFEIVEIAVGGLAPSQITLSRPTVRAHTAFDTLIMPMQVMFSKDPVEWDRTRNAVTSLTIDWLSTDVADLGDLSALALHDGIPVLDDLNFISRRLGEKITRKYEVIDSGSGAIAVRFGRTIPELGTEKGFETKTDAASFALRKILYGLRGRQKTFFLPSFREDFKLVTTIGASDLNIEVDPVEYTKFIDTADPFGDIMIELNDGTRFFRNITAAAEAIGPVREILTIDSVLGQVVTAAEVRRISYLYRSRLNADKIRIQHIRPGELSVRIPVAGVKV